MFEQIDHVALVVEDLEEAIRLYTSVFDVHIDCRERKDDQGFEMACFRVGDSGIELLAPLRPDSVIGRFLAKRGPGIHHIAFRVQDVHASSQRCAQSGLDLVDSEPRRGTGGSLICFLHPRSMMGSLVELVQTSDGHDGLG